MPRPKSRRRVCALPEVTYYKPQGVPLRHLHTEVLSHEEWEALRLRYVQNLNQNSMAREMHTSQSSIQRILTSAQKKLATAVIEGAAIEIHTDA